MNLDLKKIAGGMILFVGLILFFLSKNLLSATKYYQESLGMKKSMELAIEIEVRKLRAIFL